MVNKMTVKSRLLSVAAVLATTTAFPAAAELKYENNSGGSVLLYGQLHPGIQFIDDGVDDYSNLVDSDISNSRVGLKVRQPYPDFGFGFDFETALGLPLSSEYDQNGSTDVTGWERTDLRKIDFFIDNSNWGKFSAGQGSMASDGVSEVNLSAIGGFLYSYPADVNGLFQFRDGTGALSGITQDSVFDNFDGESRKARVRYDSPSWSGFSFALSAGKDLLKENASDDVLYDFAVEYENEFANGIEFAAKAAYFVKDVDVGANTDGFSISGSVLTPSGFGATAAYGQKGPDDQSFTPSFWYGQISYEQEWFPNLGTTSFGLNYYSGSDRETDGDSSESWGIGAYQQLANINTEIYLLYYENSYEDNSPTTYQDLSTWFVGARWKF